MGNYIKYHLNSSTTTGKVILLDGTVHEFDKPLAVAELMIEHPQQVVVEFRADLTDKRPTPLPADMKLEVNKLYFMLPLKRGKPASLSLEDARQVVSSVARSKSARFLPLFARMCHASVGEDIILRKEEKADMDQYVPELMFLDSRPEYMSRQISGKRWKPSLDTIKEKKVEKKVPHWLVFKV